MVKPIAVYQIVCWSISLVIFIDGFRKAILVHWNLFLAIMLVFIISFACYFIFINFCLLFNYKKKQLLKFLAINKWANFFQIFHISIFGAAFYIAIGFHLIVFLVLGYITDLRVGFDYFASEFSIGLSQNDRLIFLGVNTVPLFLFIFFNYYIKKIKSKASLLETSTTQML
jgi:hypothetical protein